MGILGQFHFDPCNAPACEVLLTCLKLLLPLRNFKCTTRSTNMLQLAIGKINEIRQLLRDRWFL